MKRVIGIIPARYASTRFPAKMLAQISGKSVIQRTYESAKKCQSLDALYIATDDDRIVHHAKSFGANVLMTSISCQNGTERMIDAITTYPELANANLVVNIQGDMPCIEASLLSKVIDALQKNPQDVMATAIAPIDTHADLHNPAVVKCVPDRNGHALYFSRSPIPATKNMKELPGTHHFKHIGLYAFQIDFLMRYGTLPSTPLQTIEDLEQLKVLEHGYKIRVVEVQESGPSVDHPDDIQKVEKWLCAKNVSL